MKYDGSFLSIDFFEPSVGSNKYPYLKRTVRFVNLFYLEIESKIIILSTLEKNSPS